MVAAIVVTLLVVWVGIGAGVAVLIGRAAHIGDIKHQDEVFLRPRIAEPERTPARV